MRNVQFAETATRGQAYIHLIDVKIGIESPRLLIARIKPHGRARDPTPKCASGFPCSDGFSNPFEYGHVMSWELGGPNEVENIVPMYGRWQANQTPKGSLGKSWRDMEVEIKILAAGKTNQFLYIAIVDYNDTTDTYPAQATDFQSWKQLFDWKDYRIPTGFHIYVEPVASKYGALLCQEFLDAKGLGKDYLKEQTTLLTSAYPGTPAYQKAWDHTKLPDQDHSYLLRNMTATAIDRSYNAHNTAKVLEQATNKGILTGLPLEEGEDPIESPLLDQWAAMPQSPTRDETYSYIHDHTGEIHDTLMNDFNCDASVAKSVTTATMVFADNHGKAPQRSIKLWTKNWDNKKADKLKALTVARKDKRYIRFEDKRTGGS